MNTLLYNVKNYDVIFLQIMKNRTTVGGWDSHEHVVEWGGAVVILMKSRSYYPLFRGQWSARSGDILNTVVQKFARYLLI